jgi:hypothetical protein
VERGGGVTGEKRQVINMSRTHSAEYGPDQQVHYRRKSMGNFKVI